MRWVAAEDLVVTPSGSLKAGRPRNAGPGRVLAYDLDGDFRVTRSEFERADVTQGGSRGAEAAAQRPLYRGR